MLDEARKREKVANAFLAATMAASAAQSPKDFVRTGHVEAPGTALMQMWSKKRGEAERNLDSPRVSEPARNRKKKTFKEFVEESYLIERGQPTFSSREELERHYGGIPSGKVANNASSAEKPKWRLVSAENRKGQSERNKERKRDLTSPEDMRQGEIKAKKLRKAGLDAHHITPLNYSAKLKASMSPSEWADRVKRDASNGIYHGHHHKNLMGAVTSRTPESRSKRGIRHRAGGAHELEAKARDVEHVGHKGLLAAAHKKRLRKERESNK
jgi:hypothetical protein